MSKKQDKPSQEGPIAVRALKDAPVHGLVSGALAEIPAELVPQLKAAGLIDDHPEAVAYAKAQAT